MDKTVNKNSSAIQGYAHYRVAQSRGLTKAISTQSVFVQKDDSQTEQDSPKPERMDTIEFSAAARQLLEAQQESREVRQQEEVRRREEAPKAPRATEPSREEQRPQEDRKANAARSADAPKPEQAVTRPVEDRKDSRPREPVAAPSSAAHAPQDLQAQITEVRSRIKKALDQLAEQEAKSEAALKSSQAQAVKEARSAEAAKAAEEQAAYDNELAESEADASPEVLGVKENTELLKGQQHLDLIGSTALNEAQLEDPAILFNPAGSYSGEILDLLDVQAGLQSKRSDPQNPFSQLNLSA